MKRELGLSAGSVAEGVIAAWTYLTNFILGSVEIIALKSQWCGFQCGLAT